MSENPNRYVHSLYNDAFYHSMVLANYIISIHRTVHFTNLCHYISGWGHVTGKCENASTFLHESNSV